MTQDNGPQQEIKKNLEKYLKKNDTIILAFSGGVDSVCLAHVLIELKKYKIIAAHLNHMLRGKESNENEKFVKIFAKRHGITLELKKLDIAKRAKGQNMEETGRNERYRFFRTLEKKYNASYILTAHHYNDSVETFLFNFLRGSGLKGFSGMSMLQNDILRPMLDIKKEEILKYVKKYKLEFHEDLSNMNKKFTRNFIRLELIPIIETRFPNFKNLCKNYQKIFKETDEYFRGISEEWIKKNVQKTTKETTFRTTSFLKIPKFLQQEILKNFYIQTHGSTQKLTQKHITVLQALIEKKKTGTQTTFGNLKVKIQYGRVILYKKMPQRTLLAKTKIVIPGITKLKNFGSIETEILSSHEFANDGARRNSEENNQRRLLRMYDEVGGVSFLPDLKLPILQKQKEKMEAILSSQPSLSEWDLEAQKKGWARMRQKWIPSPLSNDTHTIFVDAKSLNLKKLYTRPWASGDRIQPLGMKGTKKIHDLFIDKKIEKEKRQHIPIITTEKNEIICVGHFTIDDKFRVKNDTDRIVKFHFRPTKR